MTAYYNEHDPAAAQWLRNLIEGGKIAPGIVDERSIEDVVPTELSEFTQCHFFAGIGTWSLALRRAGWPDDCPVWTGSCPCQPFSTAGQGKGFADERHLWPAWHHLIAQRSPAVVFGEQVASQDGYAWLDLVQTDLEASGYAFGPVVLPAAGVGAPHGRHRIFFVADAMQSGRSEWWSRAGCGSSSRSGGAGELGDPDIPGRELRRQAAASAGHRGTAVADSRSGVLEHSNLPEPNSGRTSGGKQQVCDERGGSGCAMVHAESEQARISGFARERRATTGFWRDADWIPCRDGKWRPVEPGTFPLAHGVPARMVKLRAYGNSIVVDAAEEVIRAYTDSALPPVGEEGGRG